MKSSILYALGLSKGTFTGNFPIVFIILILCALTVTPKYYIGTYLMICWSFLFILTYKYFEHTSKELKQIGVLGFIFVVISVIYWVIGVSSATLAYCMARPFLFFAPLIALVIINKCDSVSKIRFLIHSISFVIAFNVADSIRIVNKFGLVNVVYQNLGETLEEMGYKGLNLGGNLFVIMVVFYSSVMFLSFLKANHFWDRLLFFLYFGISAYFIVVCSLKASAVVLFFLAILCLYVANRGKRNSARIMILSAFFILLILIFRDAIIDFLISSIDSQRITSRLMVFTSEADIEDSTTFMSREDLWLVSMQSWLRNPITFLFGIGDHNWADFESTAASGVGNHSDLLDVLARYGITGGLMLYLSLKKYFEYLKRYYGMYFKWEIIAFFILLIMMGLTKKFVAGEPAIIIFILFPLCLRYLTYSQRG